ncbi:hypothetical protein HZB03_01985 [Candidatus Woesearchaeota archaeon]|nr:hypothetical protein [Candidatus Woesearchaeota archaeon]
MVEKDNTGLFITAIVAAVAITGIVLLVLAVGSSNRGGGGGLAQLDGQTSSAGQAYYRFAQPAPQRAYSALANPPIKLPAPPKDPIKLPVPPKCNLSSVQTCVNGNLIKTVSQFSDCTNATRVIACPSGKFCPDGKSACVCWIGYSNATIPADKCEGGKILTATVDPNTCTVSWGVKQKCPVGCQDKSSCAPQEAFDEFGEPI